MLTSLVPNNLQVAKAKIRPVLDQSTAAILPDSNELGVAIM